MATWPSTSATAAPGEANGLGLWRLEMDRELGRRGPGARSAPAPGSRPRADASRRRFSTTASRSSSVRIAEVEAVEGSLADAADPGREGDPGTRQPRLEPLDLTLATPLHRTPPPPRAPPSSSRSRPADSVVELAPQRRRQAAPDRRALGDSGGDQVGSVDLERDVAPLEQVAVEPLGAHRAREDELDRVAARGRLDRLGRALRARRGQLRGAVCGGRGRRRGSRRRAVRLPPRVDRRGARRRARASSSPPSGARSDPTRRAVRARGGPRARRRPAADRPRRRSAETVPRSASRSSAAVSASSSNPNRAA